MVIEYCSTCGAEMKSMVLDEKNAKAVNESWPKADAKPEDEMFWCPNIECGESSDD